MCEPRKILDAATGEKESLLAYTWRWVVDGWTTKPHAVFSLLLMLGMGGEAYYFLQHLDKTVEVLHQMTVELHELNIRVAELEHHNR